MSLVEHAKKELDLAGLLDKDSDYGGEVGKAVLDLMGTFARQGHSGASAHLTLEVFGKLARFETLTPLTDNPDEWMEVGPGMWQSRRSPSTFSKDGGKTWYDLDQQALISEAKPE